MGLLWKNENSVDLSLKEILNEIKLLRSEVNALNTKNEELKQEINELKQKEESATENLVAHMKRTIDNQIIIEKKIIQYADEYLTPIHQNVYNMYNDVERELKSIKGKI